MFHCCGAVPSPAGPGAAIPEHRELQLGAPLQLWGTACMEPGLQMHDEHMNQC